jgi:hypothetical protein
LREAQSRNYPPNDIIMLKRQVERQLADGSTINDLAIPLFFNPSASRFESLLMSMIKGIGKVYMPGKSFIQASSAGFKFRDSRTFESLSASERSGIVWTEGYDGSELKTMTPGNPAQVLLPFNFVIKKADGTDGVAKVGDYTKVVNGKRVLDYDRVPKELTEILGFRIPTQGHNSMLPIQVVGFVPSNMGDVVIVPAAITMQMGSDFDVDKLYAYRRPYKWNKNENKFELHTQPSAQEATTTGAATDNDEAAQDDAESPGGAAQTIYHDENQMLTKYFNLAWAVLTHPEMYEKVLSPLDKPDLKNEAARAVSNATGISPFYSMGRQLDDFLSQKDAKVMVGISSLSVVFAAITEDKELRAEKTVVSDEVGEDGKPKFEQKQAGIDFIPEGKDEAIHAHHISGKGHTRYFEKDVETRMGPNGMHKIFVDPATGHVLGEYDENEGLARTKLDDLTSLQSEFLDHAKNRTIDKLNINLNTIHAALALVSLSHADGEKPNAKHLALFLRQPAIVNLVSELSRSQDSLSTTFSPDILNETVDKMVNDYVRLAAQLGDDIGHGKATTTATRVSYDESLATRGFTTLHIPDLKSGLEIKGNDADWYLRQAGMLSAFRHLTEIGKELATIQRVLNQDPRGPGKNMISVLDTISKRTNVSGNHLIKGAGDLFETEQGFIHHKELDTAATAYSDILPYEGIRPVVAEIQELLGKKDMSAEDQQDIVNEFKSYIFSSTGLGLSTNPEADRFRLLYGTNTEPSLATRVWEAKNSRGSNNYFLNRLQPQQADIPNTPSYVFYLASRASALDDQENTAAFLELLVSPDERTRRLGEDLVRYAYVTGGISGSFSFIRYIPADYLIGLPFAAHLREVNRALTIPGQQHPEFVQQWLQHNPGSMPKITLEMLSTPGNTRESLGERFELPTITGDVSRGEIGKLVRKGENASEYPRFLSYYDKEERMWKLYQRDGTREFRRVDTLGNSYIKEYQSGTSGLVRSAIAQNRSLIKQQFRPEIQTVTEEKKISLPGESALEQVGIKPEQTTLDNSQLSFVLKRIRDNERVNPEQRTLASLFDQITYALKDTRPLSLQILEGDSTDSTASATQNGILKINRNAESMDKPSFVAMVLNHEISHTLLFPFSLSNKAYKARFPEANEAYEKLKESFAEAREAVLGEIERQGYSEKDVQNALKGATVPDAVAKLAQLYYSVSSVDEFFAGIFTKADLQKFLNTKASTLESKTILGKFLSYFHDFLRGLAKTLGIHINDGSMLHTALERSFSMLEHATHPDLQHMTDTNLQRMVTDYLIGQDSTSKEAIEAVAAKINDDFDSVKVKVIKRGNIYTLDIQKNQSYYFDPKAEHEKIVTNPIDRVYGKVQEQILAIQSSIAKNKKSPEILRQRQLLGELRAMARDLKATQDLNKVGELANYQLKWATTVADQYQVQKLPVSINEIMTAHRLSSLWTDVIKLVYGGVEGTSLDIDDTLAKAQSTAELLNNRFTSQIMKQVMKTIAKEGGRQLTEADFGSDLTDESQGEAKFLSVERAKSKLVQEVALAIQNTNRHYLEDGDRLVKRIGEFEKKARALASARGIKVEKLYESMFQKGGHWGLVDEYSSAFYKWKVGLKTKLSNAVEKIMGEIADPHARTQMIRDSYAKYWKDLKRKAGYIDVRTMFDADGNIKNTAAADKFRKMMVDEYGEETTNRLMKLAQTKYNDYLQDKVDIFQVYDNEVRDGFMTADEAAAAKGQWEMENSPSHKLSTQEAVLDIKKLNMNEKYLVLVPHKNATDFSGEKFFDERYESIISDEETNKLYNEVKDFMSEFTANLPFYMEDKLGPNFLPAIRAKLVNDISQVVPYIKSMPAKLLNQLTATEYEEFMQNRDRKEIPIMYTDDPLKGLVRPPKGLPQEAWDAYNKAKEERLATYTKDLPRILELFGLMSLHYKHFSEAKDAIDLGHEVLKKADRDMSGGLRQVERNGKKITVKGGLSNTLGAVDYAIDALMYKRTKNLEGKVGEIYLKKDKEKMEHTVKELKTQVEALNKQYRNNDITKEEYETAMEKINTQLDRYEVKKFYGSKIGDTLITWAQMKALSYNPLSSINNVAFGLISAQIHAHGGEDFGTKEFFKAFRIMMNSTGRSLGLARLSGQDSAMSKTSRKVLAMMDKLGVMGELLDSDYGKSNVEHKRSGWKQTLSPMQMMRTGDYFCKGLNTIATLLTEKVTVDGKEMSVWDAHDENGNFKGKDERWQSEDVTKQAELDRVRNKVIGVNKIIMGNQDKSSPIWAKKSVLWRLVGQFRMSWFAEGLTNRFESEREDVQLGRTKKGRYRTYGDLGFSQSLLSIIRQTASAIPGVNMDPYKGLTLRDGREITETDKANMRRNLSELAWFLTLFGAMHMVMAIADGADDDEAKKRKYKFIANMLTRSYQDVALYSNPSVFDSILGTPAPALSTIKDATNFFYSSGKLMTKDDYTWDKWFLSLTRAGFIPQTTLVNKFHTMATKDLSTIQR